jgi:hypothetical protein
MKTLTATGEVKTVKPLSGSFVIVTLVDNEQFCCGFGGADAGDVCCHPEVGEVITIRGRRGNNGQFYTMDWKKA